MGKKAIDALFQLFRCFELYIRAALVVVVGTVFYTVLHESI
jgi:hypothetical protein